MIDQQTVDRAAVKLLSSAPPGSSVILFGSWAKGSARPDSDLDFLVVEPEVKDRIAEMFRLRKAVDEVFGDVVQPVDIVVMPRERFIRSRGTPNTLASEAAGGRWYE